MGIGLFDEGEKLFLEILMQGADEHDTPDGWYVGMCAEPTSVDETLTLADLTEPTGNGYARIKLDRNDVDWPVVDARGNNHRALSKDIQFAASGGDWDVACTRMFLCNVSSGTEGELINMGAPFATPVQLNDTETVGVRYALFVR